MKSSVQRFWESDFVFVVLIGLVLVATVLAYASGLTGPFVFDDFSSFVDNERFKADDFSLSSLAQVVGSSQTGPLGRPVALLSLYVNYRLTDMSSFAFKLTNLLIHLVNGGLVYRLMLSLLSFFPHPRGTAKRHKCLAFWVMSIWLLHPLNLTSVLYVVQRMASLSTLFMLVSVLAYLNMRQQQIQGHCWGVRPAIGMLVSGVLAALTKENSVAVILIIFMFEVVYLKGQAHSAVLQKTIRGVIRLGWWVMLGVAVLLYVKWPWVTEGYALRAFTLEERLMTQSRVMWFYIRLILVPDITQMSLFHDGFEVSSGVLTPMTTLVSVFGLLGLLVVCGYCVRKAPLVTLGVGWFLLGHIIESTFIPLEMIHEHRNYFPMIGIWVALVGALGYHMAVLKPIGILMLSAYVLILFSGTALRAQHWQDWPHLVASEVLKNPDSARSQFAAARWYYAMLLQDEDPQPDAYSYQQAKHHLEQVYAVNPSDLAGLISLMRLNEHVKQPPDPVWVSTLLHRLSRVKIDRDNMRRLNELLTCNLNQVCKTDLTLLNKMVMALELNPDFPVVYKAYFYYRLATFLEQKTLYQAALYYYSAAAKTEKNNQNYALNLAFIYFKLGESESAKHLFDAVDVSQLNQKMQSHYRVLRKAFYP